MVIGELRGAQELADLIDAASPGSVGDTGLGDYTTVAYEIGVGKGATITPAKGDTGKTLLIPTAGWYSDLGFYIGYGSAGNLWAATQGNATDAWHLGVGNDVPAGLISAVDKLIAISLRCVRS